MHYLNLTLRKPQTQIERQSTKCLHSTIQKWQGQKRQGKTEEQLQIGGAWSGGGQKTTKGMWASE